MVDNALQSLDRYALDAHRRGKRWKTFWAEHGAEIHAAAASDAAGYRRLILRLLAIVVSGDTDGQCPPGDASQLWELDAPSEPVGSSAIHTSARCLLLFSTSPIELSGIGR
jgi:hypothetical protein